MKEACCKAYVRSSCVINFANLKYVVQSKGRNTNVKHMLLGVSCVIGARGRAKVCRTVTSVARTHYSLPYSIIRTALCTAYTVSYTA